MKNLLPFLLMILSVGCSKDDKSNNTPSSTNLNSVLSRGSWQISQFIDSGKDETANFSGYIFTFSDAGMVHVSNSNNNIVGSWAIGNDDSSVKLILNFGNNYPFESLNEDWKVLSRSDLLIELQHISGGNGSSDMLTFNKQ